MLSSPRDLAASLRSSTADFRAMTALIAAVSLFVGAFLIFNTLSMTVTERIRELGLLRAAGATRGQLARFVLVQAAVLAVLGSVLGLAAGAGLAVLMAGYVRTVGSIPFDAPQLGSGSIAIALAVGLGVTFAASVEPARRAGSITPIEALKARLDPASARRARLRWLVAVFIAVGAAGLFAWPQAAVGSGFLRSVAVYGLLLGVVLLSPFLLGGIARVAGWPFRWLFRLEERLARAALARDRSRTALTVGAMTAGLAMIVAIGGVAGHSRAAASAWLEEVIPGEELLTSIRPIAPDEEIAADVAATDGVARVSPIATFDVAMRGVRTDASAVVGADLLADGRLRFVAGDRADALKSLDKGGFVIVPLGLATRDDLAVGSELDLAIGDGRDLPLQVAGIAERTLPGTGGETILVGWKDATESLGVTGADALAVRYEPGREADARPAVDELATESALEPTPLEPRRDRRRRRPRPGLRPLRRPGDHRGHRRGTRHRQHALDERPRAGPRARRAAGGRNDTDAGPPDRRRRGRDPRPERLVPRHPHRPRRRGTDDRPRRRDARNRARPAVGLDRTRRGSRDRPVDGRRLVSGPAGEPARDREGRPARVGGARLGPSIGDCVRLMSPVADVRGGTAIG